LVTWPLLAPILITKRILYIKNFVVSNSLGIACDV
jgi:hypothetical protein